MSILRYSGPRVIQPRKGGLAPHQAAGNVQGLWLVDALNGATTRSVRGAGVSTTVPRKPGVAGYAYNPITSPNVFTLPRPPAYYYNNTTCLTVFTVRALPATRAACGGFHPNTDTGWPASMVGVKADGNLYIMQGNNSSMVETSIGACVLNKLYAVAWTKPPGSSPVAQCSVNGGPPISVPIVGGGTLGEDYNGSTLYIPISTAKCNYNTFDNFDGDIFLSAVFVGTPVNSYLQRLTRDPRVSPWSILNPVVRTLEFGAAAAAGGFQAAWAVNANSYHSQGASHAS